MSSQDGCPRALPAPLGPTIHIGAARTLPGGHGGLVSPWGGRPWAFLPAAWALVSRATRMDDAAEDVSGGRTRVTGAKWSRRGGAVLCDMSSFFPSLATGSFWVSAVAWCPAEVPAGEHRHPGAMASSVPAPPAPPRAGCLWQVQAPLGGRARPAAGAEAARTRLPSFSRSRMGSVWPGPPPAG